MAKESIFVENYVFTRGNHEKPFYKARGIKQNAVSKLSKSILDNFPEEVRTDFDSYYIHKDLESNKPHRF